MMNSKALLMAAVLPALCFVDADARTWSDATGKFTTEAEFVGLVDGVVRLKRADGKVFSVPMARLSEADQAYVQSIASGNEAEPAAKAGQLVVISKETTHWQGPVDKTGRVDFVEALNGKTRLGVTAQDNAAIEFWQAVGLDDLDPLVADRIVKALGLSLPAKQARSFVSWEDYTHSAARRSANSVDTGATLSTDLRRWPWRAAGHPQVAKWLELNRASLDLLVQATRKSRFYSPLVSDPVEPGVHAALLPHGMAAWGVANALMTRAMLRLGTGDLDAAWSDTLACHRPARLIGQGPMEMEALVASAINELGGEGCVAIAHHEKTTAEMAARCLADLRGLSSLPLISDKLDRGQRAMLLDAAYRVAHGGPRELHRIVTAVASSDSDSQPTDGPTRSTELLESWSPDDALDWSEVLAVLNKEVDGWVDTWRVRSQANRLKPAQDVRKTVEDDRLLPYLETERRAVAQGRLPPDFSPRDMAYFFVALLAPAFDALHSGEARYFVRNDLSQVALALGAFRAKHGAYPPALAQLSPEFLSVLTRDEFMDADLRYRPLGQGDVLYSVGPDGKDNGGKVTDDGRNGDVPVVRVPPSMEG